MVLLASLSLSVAACDGDQEADLSTTSSVVTSTTQVVEREPTTTEVSTSESATSTSLVGETVTDYEVTARIPTDNGEILYVVIPTGAYTDVDLVNFIIRLKEEDPELWGIEVFDDPAAAEAYVVAEDERTEEQQALLAEHHFLTLSSGNQVDFRGPFSDLDDFILAS